MDDIEDGAEDGTVDGAESDRAADLGAAAGQAGGAVEDEQRRRHRSQLQQINADLGLAVDAAGLDCLLDYLALLQRWNRVYNLTALRDPGQMVSHHLADCLSVLPAIRRHGVTRPLRILDVGSGAGLPGVVLAIVEPDWRVTCVDAVAKKVSFIRQVAAELALPNLRAVHARVQSMAADTGFDLVVSRAFASLADFTGLTSSLLAPDGVWLAMKGHLTAEEAAALPADLEMFHVEPLQVPGLDARRCLVWIRRRPA